MNSRLLIALTLAAQTRIIPAQKNIGNGLTHVRQGLGRVKNAAEKGQLSGFGDRHGSDYARITTMSA